MMNPAQLGQLLEEHASALALYARQWSNAPEDIVQEAFLKLIAERTPPPNVAAWLFRVVRNVAFSELRSTHQAKQIGKRYSSRSVFFARPK